MINWVDSLILVVVRLGVEMIAWSLRLSGSVASPRLVCSGRLEVDTRPHGVFGVGCFERHY